MTKGLPFLRGIVSSFLLASTPLQQQQQQPPPLQQSRQVGTVPQRSVLSSRTTSTTVTSTASTTTASSTTSSTTPLSTTTTPPEFTRYTDLTSTFSTIQDQLQDSALYLQVSPTIQFHLVERSKSKRSAANDSNDNDNDNDHHSSTPVSHVLSNDHVKEGNSKSTTVSDRLKLIRHAYYDRTINNPQKEEQQRPIVVYLPGLDGTGVSGVQQFDDLARAFELWRLNIATKDRSSLSMLVQCVVDFVEQVSLMVSDHDTNDDMDDDDSKLLQQQQKQHRRPVILVGESFGGQLAPLVALQLQQRERRRQRDESSPPPPILQGMVLVNPATSFRDTNWDQLGPLLSSLKIFGETTAENPITPYSVLGGTVLSILVPDSKQVQQLGQTLLSVNPFRSTSNPIEAFVDLQQAVLNGFGSLARSLPPDLVLHRVREWLLVGSQLLTDERLQSLKVPTLVVAGAEDIFLPSLQESKRLEKLLPNCTKPSLIVPDAGHFVLDGRVNLTEAIVYNTDMDPLKLAIPNYDPITDWTPPNQKEVRQTIENQVQPLRRLTSPVFFSTDRNGRRHKGLGRLLAPTDSDYDGNPLVIVANHQLFGLDLGMILSQLIEDRNVWPRGLAHPVVTSRPDKNVVMPNRPEAPGLVEKPSGRSPNDPSTFQKFGVVTVTPRNYYRLLQTGQSVFLFPGGVREVFHGKDEAYQLFWPETPDFVRTAARFNATIIPLAAIGAADSAEILVDGPDMAQLPFGIGERLRQSSSNTTSARFDQSNDDELFVPPFFVPKIPPARHYFCFGKPFSTTNIDPKNMEQCETIYNDVKTELERGLHDLQTARETDPYKDSLPRLALEQVTGKPAPTFSVAELNRWQ